MNIIGGILALFILSVMAIGIFISVCKTAGKIYWD
jgi:hypothetical protein